MAGVESTFAPTSTTTTGVPLSVGKAEASAGRCTPRIMPWIIFAVAMTAPVLPAETKPCAPPSRTRRAATWIDEFFLVRTALAAESSMVMTSAAWRISMGKRVGAGMRRQFLADHVFLADQDDAQT